MKRYKIIYMDGHEEVVEAASVEDALAKRSLPSSLVHEVRVI